MVRVDKMKGHQGTLSRVGRFMQQVLWLTLIFQKRLHSFHQHTSVRRDLIEKRPNGGLGKNKEERAKF